MLTGTKELTDAEKAPVREIRDDFKSGVTGAEISDLKSASMLWITTSPDGPPLVVEVVLGPDNFYVE